MTKSIISIRSNSKSIKVVKAEADAEAGVAKKVRLI
jgi:hypothetical protein